MSIQTSIDPSVPDLEEAPEISFVFTPQQVADHLNCSRMHVYRLIQSGALKAVDISAPGSVRTKTRVREEDLQEYIDTLNAANEVTSGDTKKAGKS